MSILLRTHSPKVLRASYESQIASGHVRTWIKDYSGDYVHNTAEWKSSGWFRPSEENDGLRLSLYISDSETRKRAFYAEAHGAMVYSMIYHCSISIYGIEVTEDPKHGDSAVS